MKTRFKYYKYHNANMIYRVAELPNPCDFIALDCGIKNWMSSCSRYLEEPAQFTRVSRDVVRKLRPDLFRKKPVDLQ